MSEGVSDSSLPSREEAWDLVCEWIESDSLRKHALGVEAAMRARADAEGEDAELWGVCGLVHDLDYERFPDPESGHPRMAMAELERLGYPPALIEAVAGHADWMGVPRETRMAKNLYAVDELSGFVAACARVRPTGLQGMTPKSVEKKLKSPSFAAGVDRDAVDRATVELGVERDELIVCVISAMSDNAAALGLDPE